MKQILYNYVYVCVITSLVDIDECVTGAHTCDATGVTASCENTEGSFTCACNNGYEDLVSGSCSSKQRGDDSKHC